MKIPLLPQLMPARVAALALTLLIAPGLHAVTYYWDSNDSTSGFGTAGGTWAAPTTNNSTQGWSTSATGVNVMSGTTTTTTSDALNFGTASAGLAAGTITVSGTVSANSLTFGSQSGAIVLSGGTISLGGTTPTITVNNAADTISSAITGSAGLTKNGTGTLTLSGNNTYTGSTTLNAGTLRVGNNSTFGTSSVVVNSSSVILDSAAGTSYTLSNNITLNTRGTIGAATAMGNLTLGGIISGTGDLKVDTTAGVTTLTGLNTFTGNLIVDRATEGLSFNSIANAGVASAVGAGSSISLGVGASSPTFTYTGNTAASSNRSISLTGAGVYITSRNAPLTLSGNVTSTSQSFYLQGNAGGGANFNELSGIYSGGGSLNVQAVAGDVWKISGNNTYTGITYSRWSATTIAGHSNAFGSTANGTQVNNNSQILLTGNISVGAEALTLNSSPSASWNGQNGAALRSYTGNNSWAGAITLGQATTIATNSGAGLTLSGGIGGTFNLTFNSIGDTIASGNITIGTGNLNKSGAGNLTLSGNNTYTGTTTISAGTLQIGGAGLLGGGSYSAIISNSGALVYSSTANQTLSGNITGAGSLTKNNTGTLTLLGTANTYNGATTVSGGTLQLAGNITSSALTLNSGGVISVGTNSTVTTVGKANAASLTLNAGSGFALTIGNVNASVAGTDYDQITASGALTLNNTAASPFTVYLNGTPTGWNNGSIYSWDIISAASLSGVFNSGNFTTNFDSFGIAAENRTGTWSFLNPSGGTIRLTYTALAGNSTWNTGTGNWNTGSNWTENTVPNNNNNLVFTGAGGTATNNIGNGTLTTVTNITFASGAGAYTLNASAGSAGASGGTPLALIGTITNNSSNLQTINTDLAINIGSTINAASGNITIGGAISGSAGITKTGNNALTLSGANTYNGTTALNSGTLNINSATALGNGTFTITGGTIDNTSGAAITLTKNNTQNWNGDFTFTGTRDLNLGTGNVTMGASRTITVNAGNLTVLGNIAGAGFGLTKNGSGTLTINSSSTFTGAKTVNAGTLRLVAPGGNAFGSNNTVNINNGSTLQIGWVGSNTPVFHGNTVNFDSNGGGTLLNDGLNGWIQFGQFFTINTNGGAQNQLTSANGGFYNDQTANGGLILNVASGSNATADLLLAVGGSYAITKNGTGKVLVTASPTLRGITINNGVLEFGGSSTPTFSASLAFTNNGTFSYNSTASSTISQNITGTGNLTKSNTSTLTLNGTNSYTGLTTITAGTLAIGNNMTIGAIAGTGGNLSLGTGFTLTTNTSTNTTISSVVQGSGNLAKSGSGTLTLSGSNTYSGGTTLNTGTFVIGNAAAAGTGTITQTNGTSLLKLDTTGTITNAMSVYNVLATQSATLSGAITVNNATWDVDAGDTLTVSGAVAGNGGVTKIGNGTLILSGSNSYNGSTVIATGTLNAANANALGSNNTVQVNGGTLLVSADDAINGMNITLNGTSTNLHARHLQLDRRDAMGWGNWQRHRQSLFRPGPQRRRAGENQVPQRRGGRRRQLPRQRLRPWIPANQFQLRPERLPHHPRPRARNLCHRHPAPPRRGMVDVEEEKKFHYTNELGGRCSVSALRRLCVHAHRKNGRVVSPKRPKSAAKPPARFAREKRKDLEEFLK
ncbi:MAG: autotransporter-associated beta strand repeat-containing protein [Verrucomicrobia bacterium]|nr:autotransporter-associated beta strand repeat-containing protein [Verrucomicrobiota bacterium]